MQQHLPFTVLKLNKLTEETVRQFELQQHLPFTVLKQKKNALNTNGRSALQQHLPFTVLKLSQMRKIQFTNTVATAPTVYGIETDFHASKLSLAQGCNSTYRLRY